MKKIIALIFCCLTAGAQAKDGEVFLRTDAEAFADPVSIHAFMGDWKDEFSGGDKAFLDARLESGVRYGRSTLAYTWRYVYLLEFNEDTARVYYNYKNDIPMQAGEAKDLMLSARHYRAEGLRLAHDFPVGDTSWVIQLGLNLLQADDLTDGALYGNAVFEGGVIAASTVESLEGEINYHYSRPLLREEELGWKPAAPDGRGYSLDIAVHGSFSERLHFQALVNDALGYLYWDDAPATRYTVACECSQGLYDATGQLQVDEQYKQKIPFSGQAVLEYDLAGPWQGFLRGSINSLTAFSAMGLSHNGEWIKTALAYELQTKALDLRVQGKYAGLRWMADKLEVDEAHRLAVSLYAQYQW